MKDVIAKLPDKIGHISMSIDDKIGHISMSIDHQTLNLTNEMILTITILVTIRQ